MQMNAWNAAIAYRNIRGHTKDYGLTKAKKGLTTEIFGSDFEAYVQ